MLVTLLLYIEVECSCYYIVEDDSSLGWSPKQRALSRFYFSANRQLSEIFIYWHFSWVLKLDVVVFVLIIASVLYWLQEESTSV